eukprot:scaffold21901_cov59-Cyclotella_meneghiniana.AAC.2
MVHEIQETINGPPSSAAAGASVVAPTVPTPQDMTAAAEADHQAAVEEEMAEAAREEVPSPPQRVTVRRPGSRSSTPSSGIDTSSCKTTRSLINLYRRKATKNNPMPSDDVLQIRLNRELEEMAAPNVHPSLWNSNKPTKCSCLHFLRDNNIRAVCVNWLVQSMKRDKDQEDAEVVTWIRYASRSGGLKNTNEYAIPFSNYCNTTKGPLVDLTQDQYHTLSNASLCTTGIASIMQKGKDYWDRMKNQASSFGVPTPHGNIGRKRAIDDEVYAVIKDFWAEVSLLAEPRATVSVRTMTGTTNSGDDDGTIYLPSCFSLRIIFMGVILIAWALITKVLVTAHTKWNGEWYKGRVKSHSYLFGYFTTVGGQTLDTSR